MSYAIIITVKPGETGARVVGDPGTFVFNAEVAAACTQVAAKYLEDFGRKITFDAPKPVETAAPETAAPETPAETTNGETAVTPADPPAEA